MTNLGELTALVSLQVDEAAALREFQQVEARLKGKLNIPVGIDAQGLSTDLSKVKAELQALAGQGTKASKEQEAASRSLAQQYRAQAEAAKAAAAESVAGAAKIREQQAQVALTARLSAQAEQDALRAMREANREAAAQKTMRQEAIDAQRLAYSRLRAEFDAGERDIEGFNSAALDLIATLKKLEGQTDFTTRELKQLSDLRGRVERESNSAAGVLNVAGFSGGVSLGVQHGMAALLSGLSQITGMSPSLGAAASNMGILAQNFNATRTAAATAAGGMNTAATAAGVMSAGAAALGLGLAGAGSAFISLGRTGLEQTKILQGGINTLRANGENDIEGFSRKISDLKSNLGTVGEFFTRADLTASAADIVKAGTTSAEALTLMATSAKLASAESINLNDASSMLLKNLRGYGQGVEGAAKLGNQLAQAGLLASGSAQELSIGFNNVGSTAFQAKLKTSELLGMLVELDNSGLSAADRGSEGLRSALASLSDVSKEGTAQLKSWGIATEDANGQARAAGDILKDLAAKVGALGISYNQQTGQLEGNGEALRGVSKIMDTAAAAAVLNLKGKWRDYSDTVEQSNEVLDSYTSTMTEGVLPAQKRLKTAWADLGGAMTKSFAEPLADMLDTLSGVVTKMGELFEKMSAVQNIKELKTVFKIEAGDDTTAAIIKFLGRRVVDIGYGVEGVKAGIEKTGFAQNLRKLDTLGLQSELQRMGVVPTPAVGNFKELTDQFNMIAGDMEGWRKKLQAAYDAEEATRKAGAKSLTLPNVLPNALQPGRTVDLGTGLPRGDTLTKMNPAFQKLIAQLMVDYITSNPSGLAPYIHEGFRTVERQNALYEQGRSKPGKIVTNARGGESIHNYGVAADIYWRDPVTGKVVSFDDPRAVEAAKALGKLATAKGLLWGGTPGWGGPVDMPHVQENISWQTAARKYGPAGNTVSSPATDPNAALKKAIEEGRSLIKQYGLAVASGNEVWIAKAAAAVEAFKKDNKTAWGALKDDFSAIEKVAKKSLGSVSSEVSKYGQTFDRLKGKLDVTDSLNKLGQNVTPQLKAIQTEAEKAATAEKKRNGETEKYRQLLGLAADAASKLNTIQNRKPELSDLEKERQEREKQIATEKMLADVRGASAKRLKDIIAAGVSESNPLAKINAAEKELERRGELTQKAAREAREAREKEARQAMEDRERMLAQRQKDGERDIQATIELAQRQGEAEKSILLKYAEERRRLLDRAQSGTLTAEDVDAYKARLASFVKEAGKAGVASSEVLKNAHASAMKFLDTALDSNALAIANTASQYDGLSDAVSRGAARNATYQASLEDVLALLPGNADGWDDFVSLMAELDVKGNLAAGVMDGLRQKVQDLKDEMALDEGDRAAAIELANIAADPLAYADGAGRAGNTQAQAEARQRLADDLQQTLLGLDDATLQSADAMQVYEDMLTNAAQQGAITDKQLRELMDTLNLLKGGMEDFSQYADVTDGARGVKPSIGGLSPEQHIQNFEDFNATLLELTDTELQSAVGMKALEDGLKGAAASGAITEQQLSDLLDTLKLLQQAASTGGEDFSQYEGITDGARGVKAAPGADFEKQTAYAVELTAQLRQEFKGLAGDTEALAEKTAFWNDILSNAVKTGAITEGQMKALQAVMSGTVKAEELLAAAQKKVNEASGEFVGPNAAMIASLEKLRGSAGVNQEQLELLIRKLRELDAAAANQKGIEQLTSKLDQLAGNFQKAGQIAKMFTDGGENAVSILGDWVTMNTTAYKQFMSGDVAGAILTTIEGILNVGESLANLNPQLREYKKNMLEIAQLEKEAMGSKKYGNISNPYYDSLAQDAASREKLGNSKWYQRLWWNLTGSTPQVMEDGAAKLKAKAAEIFGGLADSINTLWNNAWEKAFTDGTSLDLTANLTKMLNLEVAKEAMAQVLEKANIGEYLKAYTDARAAGQDGAAQLEALRQALLKAGQDADAILKTLPGYGEGADPAARQRAAAQSANSNYQAGLKLQLDQGLLVKAEYDRLYLESEHERLRLEEEAALASTELTEQEKAQIKEKYRTQNAQLDADYAREQQRLELELASKRTNNAVTALGLQRAAGLISQAEFEQRSLTLTLERIERQRAKELASAELIAGEIAEINERYDLERESTLQALEKTRHDRALRLAQDVNDTELAVLENQYRAKLISEEEYQQRKTQLTIAGIEARRAVQLAASELTDAERSNINANFDAQVEAARLAGQEAARAQSEAYASALSGGFEAMLNGTLKQKVDNSVRQMLMGEIDQQLIAKRLSSNLAPYLDTFRQQISLGLDPTAALAQIASARDSLSASLQVQYQPLIDAFKTYFPENTSALQGVSSALRDTSFSQTTVYEAAPNVAYSSPLRARFARYA